MAVVDPNRLRSERGNGRLTRMVLATPTSEAHVYLRGAHVTHFALQGQSPLLFVSKQSQFAKGKPIRGGIPICFPWFGPRDPDPVGQSPMHGFARIVPWSSLDASVTDDRTSIVLGLSDNEQTRRWWPHRFAAHYTVTLTRDALSLSLQVSNLEDQPLTFEEALHTYFAVARVQNILIEGLDGAEYLDKTDNLARRTQSGPVTISAETDRIYLNTASACVIRDPWHRREIINVKQNSSATVVWNPWVAKAKAMPDFGDDEWQTMLCVETCNVNTNAVTLPPGQMHTMGATIRVEPIRE